MTNVYFDTAQILSILDREIPAPLMEKFIGDFSFWPVFSGTHYEDVAAAGPKRVSELSSLVHGSIRCLWAMSGFFIPQIEVQRFVSRELGETLPPPLGFVFFTMDEMIDAYPDWFEVRDLRGASIDTLRPEFEQAAQNRAAVARQMDSHKKLAALARGGAVEDWEPLLRAPPGTLPELEKRWADFRADTLRHYNSLPEKQGEAILSLDSVVLNHFAGVLAASSEFDLDLAREVLRLEWERARAIVEDRRSDLLTISEKELAILPRMQQQANPLGLNTLEREYHHFRLFRAWIGAERNAQLATDRDLAKRLFTAWMSRPEDCPGATVWRETAWAIHRDGGSSEPESNQADLAHLAVLPYVDLLFADKRIVSKLAQAKRYVPENLRAKCRRNSDFLAWLGGSR